MTKDNKNIFSIECPDCRAVLWIDPVSRTVLRKERIKKKKGSLDDLLVVEKQRKSEFERKLEATAELQREKMKRAQEQFETAFRKKDG